MKIIFLGLSITSSWGNGHATTYRGLVRELDSRGHEILFLERDVPWYAPNRDLPIPPYCRTELYTCLEELEDRFTPEIRGADLVVVGSYVPEGIDVGEWVFRTTRGVRAFYDIDTPVTLEKVREGVCDYLNPESIPRYDLYLSFSGGPVLNVLEKKFGSPMAKPFHCSVDPDMYFPETRKPEYDLGYMGTYSNDRQPPLEELMLRPARKWNKGRFVVAGPLYPDTVRWPKNVRRVEHLSPEMHREFYNGQRFTLNITRADMIRAGYSPSVRLFEAAACATPVISDFWPGLDDFFTPGRDILVASRAEDTLKYLQLPDEKRAAIGKNARRRILAGHTSAHRAVELERYVLEAYRMVRSSRSRRRGIHVSRSALGECLKSLGGS